MATKKESFVISNKNFLLNCSIDHHTNLNLNQSSSKACLHQSNSSSNIRLNDSNYGKKPNNFSQTNPRTETRSINLKSKTDSKLLDSLNLHISSKFHNDSSFLSKKNSSVKSSSTLSLHIAAYEDSIEAEAEKNDSDLTIKKERELRETLKKVAGFLPDSFAVINDNFEFPRQQEDVVSQPQITQFQPTQYLLNPNKSYIRVAKAAEIFKTPPGKQRSNWRSQILNEIGHSKFIPSSKILWSLAAIKSKVEKLTKYPKSKWENALLEVGDPAKWEQEYTPEFGPHIDQGKYIMENKREYTMAFVMLCVQLSWMGVKDLKIPSVIGLITSFFGIAIERIPDQSTVTRWCNEQIIFVDMQIREFFENAENLSLHSDETTLSGDKLQSYIICKVVNGIRQYMIVGIEQVADKSAARSLKAFLACMKRSIDVFNNLPEEVIEYILTERLGKIVNLVGDRASTQKKFNKDFQELTGNDITAVYCQHHILASLWDVFVDACLRQEKIKFDEPERKVSLIKTAVEIISSYFGERSGSNQKAKEWNQYAAEKNLDYFTFPSKLGSRWNIGPSICAALYYHRKNLLDFLQSTNYAVEKCFAPLIQVLENTFYINLIKIGAAIDQVINGPWWKELESDKHIFEINVTNGEIVEYLEKVADNPLLFQTEIPLLTSRSDKQIVYRNAVLADVTPAFLAMIPDFYRSTANYLKKQFESLSMNPKMNDEQYRDQLASAAATNIACEQSLSVAAHYRHESASKSNVRIGYTVAAVKNGVGEWYNNKSAKERNNIDAAAKAARQNIRRRLRENKQAIKEELIQHQKKQQLVQQRKKSTKPISNNLDYLICRTFTEKMEDEEGEYFCMGFVERKSDDGYIICYPGDEEGDTEENITTFITSDDLITKIDEKIIIFNE